MIPEQRLGMVMIGPREIYDQLVMLTKAVTELRGELARLVDAQSAIQDRLNNHGDRLHALERRVWTLPGTAALLAAIGIVVSVLVR